MARKEPSEKTAWLQQLNSKIIHKQMREKNLATLDRLKTLFAIPEWQARELLQCGVAGRMQSRR